MNLNCRNKWINKWLNVILMNYRFTADAIAMYRCAIFVGVRSKYSVVRLLSVTLPSPDTTDAKRSAIASIFANECWLSFTNTYHPINIISIQQKCCAVLLTLLFLFYPVPVCRAHCEYTMYRVVLCMWFLFKLQLYIFCSARTNWFFFLHFCK